MTYLPHKTPGPPWPPLVGEALPRAVDAYGVREKLADYSLNAANEIGKAKAAGFDRILGITVADIDYLEGAIYTGILLAPVIAVRANPPWGVNCVVTLPVRGVGAKRVASSARERYGCSPPLELHLDL